MNPSFREMRLSEESSEKLENILKETSKAEDSLRQTLDYVYNFLLSHHLQGKDIQIEWTIREPWDGPDHGRYISSGSTSNHTEALNE